MLRVMASLETTTLPAKATPGQSVDDDIDTHAESGLRNS